VAFSVLRPNWSLRLSSLSWGRGNIARITRKERRTPEVWGYLDWRQGRTARSHTISKPLSTPAGQPQKKGH